METDWKPPPPGPAQMIVSVHEPSLAEGARPVARSHAKQLLQRAERFEKIVFDFRGIEWISPAFADEIFRVFALQHPAVELIAVNTNLNVEKMVAKARNDLDTFLRDN